MVNLSHYHPNLRMWIQTSCSNDLSAFAHLLKYVQEHHSFSNLEDLLNTSQGGEYQ